MVESSRRYNLRDTRKKPQGVPLERWEVEYSELVSNGKRRIPLEKIKNAIRSAFEDGMFEHWRITLKCPTYRMVINIKPNITPSSEPEQTHSAEKEIQSTPSDPNEVDRMNFDLDVEEDVVVNFSSPDTPQMLVINDKSQSVTREELLNTGNDFNTICNAFEPTNDDFVPDMQIDDISSFGILHAIREIECKTNTTDDSRGLIKEIQTSDVTDTSVIGTDHASDNGNARLSKQHNAQSSVNSDTSGDIAASVTSAPLLTKTPSSECPKVQIEHLQIVESPTKLHLRRRKHTPYLDANLSESEDGLDECLFKYVTRKRGRPSRTEKNMLQIHENNSLVTSVEDNQNQEQRGFGESSDESKIDDEENEYELETESDGKTLTGKTRAYHRKENHRKSNKSKIQSNSRPKAGSQFKKKLHDIGAKRAVIGEESHKCQQCHFATSVKSNLTRHMRIHTGEKPFKCKKCNYSAARHSVLIVHQRIHTGERPFKCKTCSYAAKQRPHLIEHERTHSAEKPYKCHLCKFASAQGHGLTEHIRSHTGETPYKCRFCQYTSGNGANLNAHMRKHHKDALKMIYPSGKND